jgi:hypothetical protein
MLVAFTMIASITLLNHLVVSYIIKRDTESWEAVKSELIAAALDESPSENAQA